MSIRLFSLTILTAFACSTFISQVQAIPTVVHFQDAVKADGTTHCDPLFIPQEVDEIGDPAFGFPNDEALSRVSTDIFQPVCIESNDPTAADALVEITNLTGRDLTEVWYIANNETRISNYDGYANDIGFAVDADNEAFRLDHDLSDPGGKHHPLVFESGPFNGIWEAGETWGFILQDYSNAFGLPADALTSIGVGDASVAIPGVPFNSSGSIIAIPRIPEPTTCMLMAIGLAALSLRRR